MAVIAERGFAAATMAEIAARAGAPIGSLYRFFPGKEVLADALAQRFSERLGEIFEDIRRREPTVEELADALLSLMGNLRNERLAARALLEAHPEWRERGKFRQVMTGQIAQTLRSCCPGLPEDESGIAAIALLHVMKAAGALSDGTLSERRAAAELREMARIYLEGMFQRFPAKVLSRKRRNQ